MDVGMLRTAPRRVLQAAVATRDPGYFRAGFVRAWPSTDRKGRALRRCSVRESPAQRAEARGFEPRMGANPNRISRVVTGVPGTDANRRNRADSQVSAAGACRLPPGSP